MSINLIFTHNLILSELSPKDDKIESQPSISLKSINVHLLIFPANLSPLALLSFHVSALSRETKKKGNVCVMRVAFHVTLPADEADRIFSLLSFSLSHW